MLCSLTASLMQKANLYGVSVLEKSFRAESSTVKLGVGMERCEGRWGRKD